MAASLSIGCGKSAVPSGSAIGKIGGGLSTHAHAVPQGSKACAIEHALDKPGAGTSKDDLSETCSQDVQRDFVWQKALIVISAYSQRLGALAAGEKPETAGQLDAYMTGVQGSTWAEADPETDKARDAVAKLVSQLTAGDEKADLAESIKQAGPHVKVVCDGLQPYLQKQAQRFGELRTKIQSKRDEGAGRRCVVVNSQTICVPESMTDRLVYAGTFGELVTDENGHLLALDAATSFCAAHAKLVSAAADGAVEKDETYKAIIDAVKAAPRRHKPPKAAASASGDAASK